MSLVGYLKEMPENNRTDQSVKVPSSIIFVTGLRKQFIAHVYRYRHRWSHSFGTMCIIQWFTVFIQSLSPITLY